MEKGGALRRLPDVACVEAAEAYFITEPEAACCILTSTFSVRPS